MSRVPGDRFFFARDYIQPRGPWVDVERIAQGGDN